jgi:hypothetical protein
VRSTTPRGSSTHLLSLGWFPSNKWRFLRHLSLADNALTHISGTSLAPLANTLQSLDLSSNLFVEIPDSLATLSCLRALNLSNCMIESLHSLSRNPLPAITTLNLRSNRLTSLAGVERIPTLERVDLRDNKLTDPTEIARLTGVPDSISDIYVHRNPFCKSYSNYRVTIFNLFRKTPGYTQDIVIDCNGPNNSERKQLVDRAPELPSVPVVKPPPEDEADPPPKVPPKVIIPIDGSMGSAASPRRTNSHHRSKSGLTGSQRRKKAPKRRVVELAQSEIWQDGKGPPIKATENPFASITPSAEAPSTSNPAADVTSEVVLHFEEPQLEPVGGDPTKKATPQEADPDPPAPSTQQRLLTIDTGVPREEVTKTADFDVTGDLYKKKIEALRQDFGNSWLSALGDETSYAPPISNFSEQAHTSPVIKPPLPRTPSQGIVSGGRTLG